MSPSAIQTQKDINCRGKCSLIDIFNDTVIIEQREERDKVDEESKRQEAVDEIRDLMVKNTLSQQIRIISLQNNIKMPSKIGKTCTLLNKFIIKGKTLVSPPKVTIPKGNTHEKEEAKVYRYKNTNNNNVAHIYI